MSVDTDSQNTAVPNRVLHEESLRSSPDGTCPARLSDEYMYIEESVLHIISIILC